MNKNKTQLKGLTLEELQSLFFEMGEAKFRALQVFNWMYNFRVTSFDKMENLSKPLRSKLKEDYSLITLNFAASELSTSGTKKLIFETEEGNKIESVIIPDEKRNTICISTQVGCPLDCKFCATGLMGYKKNLSAGEIFDQYLLAQQHSDIAITNIVYMGMGEPLLNFNATLDSLKIFSEQLTKGINLKKITVSTAGIAPKIIELADTGLKPKLALSLHSCNERTRSKIMPINDKYSLKENLEAAAYYAKKTKTRITFEYIMLKGINDRDEDIKALIKLTNTLPSKINVIPFNSLQHMHPTGFSASLFPTEQNRIEEFVERLRDNDVTVMVRETQGDDIAAACGQLAVKFK